MKISRMKTLNILKNHGVTDAMIDDELAGFYKECGHKSEYSVKVVKRWLGY